MEINKEKGKICFNQALFMDAFDELIVCLSGNLEIEYANKAFLDKTGYTSEQLVGAPFEMLLPVADKPSFCQQTSAVLKSENHRIELEHGINYENGKTDHFLSVALRGSLSTEQPVIMLRLKCLTDMRREKDNLEIIRSLYISIAEQTRESFFMHDEVGKILDVNQYACDKLGYTRSELLGMIISDLELSFDQARARALWTKIQPGESVIVRGRQKRRDGTTIPVEISFGCTEINGEKLFFDLVRDITSIIQAEKRYKTIVEAAPDPIFIQTEQKFAYLNPAACAFFGIASPEEVVGTPVVDRFAPAFKEIILKRINRLNEDRQPVNEFQEYNFQSKGGLVWGETKGVPFEYEGKHGALVFLRDVTQRKATEEALKKSEKRYELLFNKSAVPLILTKLPEHTIVEVNDAWVALFGYGKDEAVGKTTTALGLTKELITDQSALTNIQNHGVALNVELKLYSKSGEELTVLDNICILNYDGDRFALISNQDITERKRSEERLYESNEQFSKSFEYSALAACLISTDGQLLHVNKMMCQVFGYTAEELVGKHVNEITYPDDVQLTNEAIHKLLNNEVDSVTLQKRYLRKNGEFFWAVVTTAVIRDIENRPVHVITQIHDVTEIRHLMDELRASEEFSRTVMDNLPIGISVNSNKPPLVFSYMNDKFPEFYRTTREALNGTDVFFDAVYEEPEFREKIRKRVMDDMSSNDPARMQWEDVPITRAGQETRYISAYNTIVPEKDLHISIVTDETDRVRALEELKSNTTRLQAIHDFDLEILRGFESLYNIGENALIYILNLIKPHAVGIAILDLTDTVMHVVKTVEDQVAVQKYEIEISERELAQLGELSNPAFHNYIQEKPQAVIERIFACSCTYNCYNIPIFTSGRLRGIINISYTPPNKLSKENIETVQELATQVALAIEQTRLLRVTELYATSLEEMISERTAELEETNKELESFTFSVSHDLRAPLRSMNGFVRILMEDYDQVLDDEGRRICAVIANSAQNMGQLIDDLLSLSRVGRSSLELSEVDMKTLTERVYTDLTTEEQRAVIDFRVGELPSAYADLHLIRQVWANLIDNAVKFTSKRDTPQISITAELSDGEIVYAVKDNGAGFNMTYQDKLFGVFQRLHSQKEFSGTGVGLAIVSRIVRRHGGRVWATGEENAGATFYFSLKREEDNNAIQRD